MFQKTLAFRIFFSLLVVNMFVEALVPSAVLCLAEASFFSGSVISRHPQDLFRMWPYPDGSAAWTEGLEACFHQ